MKRRIGTLLVPPSLALISLWLGGCSLHSGDRAAGSVSPCAATGVSRDTAKSMRAEQPVVPCAYVDSTDPAQEAAPAKPASDVIEELPQPRPAATRTLSLDQAINLCLVADPRLRAGFEAINQANADALTASLKPNPSLFTDIQLLPLTRPFTVTDQGGPPQQDVIVTYPIDWFLFGKRAAAMASTARGVRASEAEFADLVRQRVTEVALAFYDILESRGLLELARQDVENWQRLEEVMRKGAELGSRPQVELNRIRLDLLNSRRMLRDAELALNNAVARLRVLLGSADAAIRLDISGTLDLPPTGGPLPLEEAFDLALQNRPDLQALRLRHEQAQAALNVERRKAYPDVAPALGYTRQYQTQAIGFPDANSWSASVTMSLPFCNRNQGNQAKALSVVAQTLYEWQAAQVKLYGEIEMVRQEFLTARANAEAVAREQLQLAAQVRDTINETYLKGGRPLIDALDAQRNFRDTYRIFITSRANYWRALYRYQSAIGRQVVQ